MHRWKLSALAAAALVTVSLTATDAWALSLGRLSVQSGLGEPLRAQVELPQITAAEADSLRASIASPAAFRAQGMEYTAAASQLSVQLQRRPDGSAVLQLSSAQPVTDAFVDLVIDATWSAGQVVRSYTLLLNTPADGQRAPATNAPQIAPAPAALPTPQAAPRSAPARTAPVAARIAPAAPAAVSVRSGDTASQIAQAHRPAGVSLDQMLVAMLRANPHAFISGNVNRMRAGAVMELPDQAAAQATSIREARQIVAAQSQDFNRYRRQLASAAPAATVTAAQRSARGNVEAQVDDRKPGMAAPDKLTLSKAAAADERLAREKQAQSQSDRMAELSRNLNELQNVAGAAPARVSAPAAGVPAAGVPAAGAPAVGVPGVPAVGASAAQVPAPDTAAAAPAPAATETTPAVPAVAAPDAAASDTAALAAAASAAAASAAPTPETPAASAAPVPAPAAPAAAPTPEPAAAGDRANPALPLAGIGLLALPLAGIGLLALLLGYMGYRQYQRRRTPGASTDTQLPEDSRIDQDPQIDTAQPQFDSPAHLPSQLDGDGEIDPLAEADAYLAYGRDVQAEEVLKEALRNQPERLALHQKLADIHAKRQDRKAFEVVAQTVFALTQGKGAEWLHLAEQGRALDPANTLYQAPGAALPAAADDLAAPVRPGLEERAMAQASVAAAIGGVAASAASAARSEPVPAPAPASSPDLDLGLGLPASEALSGAAPEAPLPADIGFEPIEPVWKQPAAPADLRTASGLTLPDLELRRDATADALPADAQPQAAAPIEAPKPAPNAPQSAAPASPPSPEATPKPAAAAPAFDFLEFDMGNLSLDLGDTPPADALSKSNQAAAEDPLTTKLALAQEFAALGDSEGARTLLEEVIDEAEGELKERAQRQLAEIK